MEAPPLQLRQQQGDGGRGGGGNGPVASSEYHVVASVILEQLVGLDVLVSERIPAHGQSDIRGYASRAGRQHPLQGHHAAPADHPPPAATPGMVGGRSDAAAHKGGYSRVAVAGDGASREMVAWQPWAGPADAGGESAAPRLGDPAGVLFYNGSPGSSGPEDGQNDATEGTESDDVRESLREDRPSAGPVAPSGTTAAGTTAMKGQAARGRKGERLGRALKPTQTSAPSQGCQRGPGLSAASAARAVSATAKLASHRWEVIDSGRLEPSPPPIAGSSQSLPPPAFHLQPQGGERGSTRHRHLLDRWLAPPGASLGRGTPARPLASLTTGHIGGLPQIAKAADLYGQYKYTGSSAVPGSGPIDSLRAQFGPTSNPIDGGAAGDENFGHDGGPQQVVHTEGGGGPLLIPAGLGVGPVNPSCVSAGPWSRRRPDPRPRPETFTSKPDSAAEQSAEGVFEMGTVNDPCSNRAVEGTLMNNHSDDEEEDGLPYFPVLPVRKAPPPLKLDNGPMPTSPKSSIPTTFKKFPSSPLKCTAPEAVKTTPEILSPPDRQNNRHSHRNPNHVTNNDFNTLPEESPQQLAQQLARAGGGMVMPAPFCISSAVQRLGRFQQSPLQAVPGRGAGGGPGAMTMHDDDTDKGQAWAADFQSNLSHGRKFKYAEACNPDNAFESLEPPFKIQRSTVGHRGSGLEVPNWQKQNLPTTDSGSGHTLGQHRPWGSYLTEDPEEEVEDFDGPDGNIGLRRKLLLQSQQRVAAGSAAAAAAAAIIALKKGRAGEGNEGIQRQPFQGWGAKNHCHLAASQNPTHTPTHTPTHPPTHTPGLEPLKPSAAAVCMRRTDTAGYAEHRAPSPMLPESNAAASGTVGGHGDEGQEGGQNDFSALSFLA